MEISALLLSVKVALTATLGQLPFAILIAYILTRTDFYGKSAVNLFVHLPLVLPPVVTGYFLLVLFGTKGVIGNFLHEYLGIQFAFRWTGAALASAIMSFPLVVRAIQLSFEGVNTEFEAVARTLGAGRIKIFVKITLPLAYRGILAGLILGFAKSLGEFGATITFVSNIPDETQTLSLAVYTFLQDPNGSTAALRLAGLSILVSMIALTASDYFVGKTKKVTA
jgi:molybdate transport system permease protein